MRQGKIYGVRRDDGTPMPCEQSGTACSPHTIHTTFPNIPVENKRHTHRLGVCLLFSFFSFMRMSYTLRIRPSLRPMFSLRSIAGFPLDKSSGASSHQALFLICISSSRVICTSMNPNFSCPMPEEKPSAGTNA